MRRSTPPARRAGGLFLVGVAQVGVGDLAEGGELGARPELPATQRGRSAVADSSAACAGDAGGGQVSSWARSAMPYSARTDSEGAEAVGLDDVDTPRRGRTGGARATTSGRVTTSISLHPSSAGPPKSSAVRSAQLEVGAGGAVEDDHPAPDAPRDRRHRVRPWAGPRAPAPGEGSGGGAASGSRSKQSTAGGRVLSPGDGLVWFCGGVLRSGGESALTGVGE